MFTWRWHNYLHQAPETRRLQDTHAQNSGESEFCALGAGCADGLYVEAILNDLGVRAKINLRGDAKAAIALAQRQGEEQRLQNNFKSCAEEDGELSVSGSPARGLRSWAPVGVRGKPSDGFCAFRPERPTENGRSSGGSAH